MHLHAPSHTHTHSLTENYSSTIVCNINNMFPHTLLNTVKTDVEFVDGYIRNLINTDT